MRTPPSISEAKAPVALSSGERAEPRQGRDPSISETKVPVVPLEPEQAAPRWRVWSLALIATATMAITGAADLQAGSNTDLADQTIGFCSNSAFDIKELSSGLTELGWLPVKYQDFTEAHVRSYAAIRLVAGYPISVTSNTYWKKAWSRSIIEASNLDQVDIARNFRPERMFFTAPKAAGILSAGVIEGTRGIQDSILFCTFVATPELTTARIHPDSTTFTADTTLPMVRFRNETSDDSFTVKRRVTIHLLNNRKMGQLINAKFPYISFVAIVQSRPKDR